MEPGFIANARVVAASAALVAMLALLPLPALAGPALLHSIADESPHDGGAGGDSEGDADGQAQRQPDTDAPSEDGTDGSTGENAAEPPAGCLFRDGPLELVV